MVGREPGQEAGRGCRWWCWTATALALLCGCQEFETAIQYEGPRRLSELPLEVRSVFWTPSGPLVFAAGTEEGRRVLHIVPLSREAPCRVGIVDRFAAVVRDGDLRLAVFDSEAGEVRFVDETCQAWTVPVEGVTGLWLRSHPEGSWFLLETGDADLWLAVPETREVRRLAQDVEQLGSAQYRVGDQGAFWLQTAGRLQFMTMEGAEIGGGFPDVRRYATYLGPGSDGERHAFAVVQQERRVQLFDVSAWVLRGRDSPAEGVWVHEDACGARIDAVVGACTGDACSSEDPRERVPQGLVQVPWTSYFAPCGDRRLVLRADGTGPEFVVAEGVDSYRVLGIASEGRPVVLLRKVGHDVEDYLAIAGEPPVGLGFRVSFASVQVLGAGPDLAFVTGDGTARLVLYRHGRPPRTVLSGVAAAALEGLALHDFDGGVGRLSLCEVLDCTPIAEDVPPGRYIAYETVERVGDPLRLMAFVHRADGESGAGQLAVLNRRSGALIDVAERVTAFSLVEFGGARGLVYTVQEGPERGLWYAAR